MGILFKDFKITNFQFYDKFRSCILKKSKAKLFSPMERAHFERKRSKNRQLNKKKLTTGDGVKNEVN